MSVVVREVTNPSEADLAQYTKVLAEAFGYQFFGTALGGDRSLQEPTLLAQINAALVNGEGEVHVAELPEVGVVGVAVWFGPGQKFLTSEAQHKAGWDQVMERLPAEYREWWDTFLVDYDALVEKSLGPGVKVGSYHLQLLGTAPDHQRKGVAKALTQYGDAKARAAGVSSVLETVGPTNVSIYKALGYEVAGSGPIKVPPPAAGGSFEMSVIIKHTEVEGLQA
ncbi:uncharacterized protein TRAVEDRAFT_65412 [Trametes versicolor FP-101664 SS1]|uniref:uncharacterized protein n=1 Tax=Trametes versicolor (strain FP-101664) TaxID=717944 RepID=UPI0004623C49|nr:uncharacterized protein TRAVEDRAFT_65412 [Trametes versicolor FP-101664 SS1]EIW57678.1 hypothetical protein TRAVEDRAFT_65412 [Trametes versicolor FP-101664 SS1]